MDGELPPAKMMEIQGHLEVCSDCRETLTFSTAIRRTTQSVADHEAPLSAHFEQKMRRVLADEVRREAEQGTPKLVPTLAGLSRSSSRRKIARTALRALPIFAAAAALALWLQTEPEPGSLSNTNAVEKPSRIAKSSEQSKAWAASSTDDLLDGMIDHHTEPATLQVTDARKVRQLGRDVGVLVGLPASVEKDYEASWQGGRVVRMSNNQRAVQLRYRTRDNRNFTVYIYDPKKLPLHAGLKPSRLYNEPVYVGQRRGYSIAASKQAGIGYAVAGDLNPKDSARLVRTIAYSH